MFHAHLSGTVGKLRSWGYRAIATKLKHSSLQQIVLNIFLCVLYLEKIVGNKTKFYALLESIHEQG